MRKAVIFDVDGTLVDSVDLHTEAWRLALSAFGKELPFATIREQIGKGSDQLLPVFLDKEQLAAFGDELTEYRGTLYRRDFLPKVRPFPAVRELFERLRSEDKQVALASSSKSEELETYLRLMQVDDLVSVTVSADDVDRSKPHPDIFRATLDKLALPAREAVVVGDTPYDAQAAVSAGITSVGLLCGGFPEASLREAGCQETHRDPADLLTHYATSRLSH